MEDNKVLLAIASEIREIKAKLAEQKQKEIEPENEEPQLDYVAATEQRFIGLNQKLDQIQMSQKRSASEQSWLIWAGIVLSLSALLTMILTILKPYIGRYL